MRHAVLDVKNDCSARHNDSCCLDDSSLEPCEKKFTCAGVRRMRGVFGVMFTQPVAYKGFVIACKRNTLTLGLKKKLSFIPT